MLLEWGGLNTNLMCCVTFCFVDCCFRFFMISLNYPNKVGALITSDRDQGTANSDEIRRAFMRLSDVISSKSSMWTALDDMQVMIIS